MAELKSIGHGIGLLGLVLAGCGDSANGMAAADAGVAAGNAAALAPAPLKAAALAEPLPPLVTGFVDDMRKECTDSKGRFDRGKPILKGSSDYYPESDPDRDGRVDYYETADFNGDGKTDYMLTPTFSCTLRDEDGSEFGATFFTAGQCGSNFHFVVSSSSGYREHQGFCAQSIAFERKDGRDLIIPGGGWRDDVDRVEWGWDGAKIALLRRLNAQGRAVDESGDPLSGGARSAAMPLPKGYYAVDGDCAGAAADPVGASLGYLDDRQFVPAGGGCAFVAMRKVSDGLYRETYRCEDEEGANGFTGTSEYRIVGAQSFASIEDGSRREWRFCPATKIPAASRFYQGRP